MTKMLKTIALWSADFAAPSEMLRIPVRWWTLHRAWWVRRATARALEALGDHQLKDIGLHRSEIGAAIQVESHLRHRRS